MGTLVALAAIFLGSGGLLLGRQELRLLLPSFSNVLVAGCFRTTPSEVVDWMKVGPQANALWASVKELRAQIEKHPWVQRATVRRRWPRRLEISVTEHKPAALLWLDAFYLIDWEGNVFTKVEQADYHDLPVITGLAKESVLSNSPASGTLARQALLLLNTIDNHGLLSLSQVSELHTDSDFGLTVMLTNDAIQIKFGFAPFGKKVDRLVAVREDLGKKKIDCEWIDLRFDERVYVLPKREG